MNIKIDSIITKLDGEPYKNDKGGDLTLKDVLVTALTAPVQGDYHEKITRAKWARRVNGAGETVELSAEEIASIKPLIGAVWSPMIVLGAEEAIEAHGAAATAKKAK